ncbi:Ubiquinone biosynthesis O-methyltransferase [ANME-1 cluster archaeon GoMg2]|nr:Ubiquinone biosynthesis O-methyltransferase [ANME-1 cluster archaeon GoMg2]
MRVIKLFEGRYYEEKYGTLLLKGEKPFYHRFWMRYLRKYKESGRLLDLGCGLGFFLRYAEKYYETYGIDLSHFGIKEAKKRCNTEMVVGSATYIPFKDNYFDVITCFDLLEHMENPKDAIAECYRLLKDDGLLVITTPNISSNGLKWKKEKWFGFRDETHISLLSNDEWINMLKKNSFKIVDVFYDGLWDTPYFEVVPRVFQDLMIKYPSIVLFGFGLKFPRSLGENLCIVACKR